MSDSAPDVKLAPAPEEPALAPQAPPAEHQESMQCHCQPAPTPEAHHEAEEPVATAPPATEAAPDSDASHEADEPAQPASTQPEPVQQAAAQAESVSVQQEEAESVPVVSSPEADPRHVFIEQIFQKVEEESERRAHQEEARSRPSTGSSPSAPASQTTVAVAVARDPARERDRRRGSISVSRFGQATDLSTGTHDNPSTLPSRQNSLIINAGSTGAFYQAQKYAGSADSFASDTAHHDQEVHDEEQVTQMETIAGRVSLGKAVGRTIARRLSRARSRELLTAVPTSGLVIGVSVEEATVEAEHHDDEKEGSGDVPPTPQGTVFAFAQAEGRGTRSRRSTVSMPNPNPPQAQSAAPAVPTGTLTPVTDKRSSAANWVLRAKDFTKLFKRRSMAVLPQNSSP